jgi:glycosyltransferase involved in cell wall biosynthesis
MHNVLMLLYTLEPAGAEKVVLSLVDRLDRRRFRPVVCAFRGGGLRGAFERHGVPVYVLNKKRGPDPRVFWQLVRLIQRHRINIVHSHNFSANLWGRLAAIVARVPVRIATEHSMPWVKSALQRTIDRSLARVTTRIVSVSGAVREAHMRDEGISPEKITVVYNGIESVTESEATRREFAAALRMRLGLPATGPLCITVGRLEPPKGHQTLLQAVRIIHAHVPDARFLLVGDGSLRSALEELGRRLGIEDSLRFMGARDDVRRLLSVSTVAIVPSTREGFSIAVLEAMAAGLPIVATNVGGNAEALVPDEAGLVVAPLDPRALAEAVRRVLIDPALATRLGSAARKRFEERFTIDHMIHSIEELYSAASSGRD